MTKSPRKNVPDVESELGAAYMLREACMPSKHASHRATALSLIWSFGKGTEMSKIMQNGIFTLFVRVSIATVNMQTDVWT